MQLLESKVFNAIRNSQYKQLNLFIRHDYNLNVVSQDGRNGLFYALDIPDSRKRCRMIRFCLEHGIDPTQKEKKNNYTPLHEAVARQQLDSIQLLIENAGGEIDWRSLDSQGRSILHQAVESNNLAILEALINVMSHYRISVDIPDKNGLTPYLLAIKLHLPDMVYMLVNKGHASRKQCDLMTHRNADEWEMVGIEEHRLLLREQLRQEIEYAMRDGKITKAKQLRKIYYAPVLLTSEPIRRDSFLSMTTASGPNPKSSIVINEIMEQLPDGEIPESFVPSERDRQTFYLEYLPASQETARSTLPKISTERQNRSNVPFNPIVDLFQVVTDQISPSYRSPMRKIITTTVERSAPKKTPISLHRSTLATMKTSTDLSSRSRHQRNSNSTDRSKPIT